MSQETALSLSNSQEQTTEARLIGLVLDSVTSGHSRRSYRTGLVRFFIWIRNTESTPHFSKALVGKYSVGKLLKFAGKFNLGAQVKLTKPKRENSECLQLQRERRSRRRRHRVVQRKRNAQRALYCNSAGRLRWLVKRGFTRWRQ